MPKIVLKPNSPEYVDPRENYRTTSCDMPGCARHGENKAPKHRGLNEYYHFCEDHIREYNKAWNFFEGMAASEVEEHMYKSMYGDRPTWKYGVNGDAEEALYNKAWQTYNGTSQEPPHSKAKSGYESYGRNTPEYEAMAIMGLEPPIALDGIKTRYKELAKKYHPDLNRGCSKSEELLKQVNMAYTILKLAHEKFDDLPERT